MIPNLEKPTICWDINKKIYKKHNAVPIELCEEIISYGEKNVRKGENKYPKAFKNSFHAALLPLNHKVHSALDNVWNEIIKHFNIDLTFVEPYELKRYTDADFFGSHSDNYYGLTTDIDRKITMVIQLSDEQSYKFGELKIIDISAPKNRGSVVAFPSFFRHEVLRTIGTRWSLIGWAWGPYWK